MTKKPRLTFKLLSCFKTLQFEGTLQPRLIDGFYDDGILVSGSAPILSTILYRSPLYIFQLIFII